MDDIHNTFRRVNRGDTEMEDNTAPQTASRFVDSKRLGMHQEWQRSKNPREFGRIVSVPNSIEDAVYTSMDSMKHRGSFFDESQSHDQDSGCITASCGESPNRRRRG